MWNTFYGNSAYIQDHYPGSGKFCRIPLFPPEIPPIPIFRPFRFYLIVCCNQSLAHSDFPPIPIFPPIPTDLIQPTTRQKLASELSEHSLEGVPASLYNLTKSFPDSLPSLISMLPFPSECILIIDCIDGKMTRAPKLGKKKKKRTDFSDVY